MKSIIKNILRRFNIVVSRVPRGRVRGLDLIEDLRCLLGNGEVVCFDIGANVGQTVELLQFSLVKPIIYAFEPSAKSFEILSSKDLGESVKIFKMALGANSEKKSLYNYRDSCLNSFLSISANDRNEFSSALKVAEEDVVVDTIDNVIFREKIKSVDLLKVDTQGYDLTVLSGATESLSRGKVRSVLIELNFAPIYEDQCAPTEVIRFLEKFGLHLVDFYEKHRVGNQLAWCTALFTLEGEPSQQP